jgi:hypothetical protein
MFDRECEIGAARPLVKVLGDQVKAFELRIYAGEGNLQIRHVQRLKFGQKKCFLEKDYILTYAELHIRPNFD